MQSLFFLIKLYYFAQTQLYRALKFSKCWDRSNFHCDLFGLKITSWVYMEYFRSYFLLLTVVVLMSTFKNKSNSLRTTKAKISQKVKNNEARPKFTGSYKKKACSRENAQIASLTEGYWQVDRSVWQIHILDLPILIKVVKMKCS